MSTCMKRPPGSSDTSLGGGLSFIRPLSGGPRRWRQVAREVQSSFYSRSSGASGARRRMRGVEGWGRHLRNGAHPAATSTYALTHPSNLCETRMRLIAPRTVPDCSEWESAISPCGPSNRNGRRLGRVAHGPRSRCRPVTPYRVEEARQAAGQRDHGDIVAAARGDAGGPTPPGARPGIAHAPDRPSCLDEPPAHAAIPGFGDPAASFALPRAELRGTRPR